MSQLVRDGRRRIRFTACRGRANPVLTMEPVKSTSGNIMVADVAGMVDLVDHESIAIELAISGPP